MLRKILAGFAVSTVLVALASPVNAESTGGIDCPEGMTPAGRQCRLIVSVPGSGGSSGQTGSSRVNSAPRTCAFGSIPMPCSSEQGWWSNERGCYVQLASFQPPKSAQVWEGHTDGAIYDCSLPRQSTFGSLQFSFWAATAPVGPDPRVLAQQAVQAMNLRAVSIGIVPEDAPGSVGLVGMPVWLWVEDPDQHTWGPITRTASAGGATVTATGKVQKVRWQLGDGAVVVCGTPGTPYEDRFGKSPSPTCGHTYTKQGTYTVRAESSWVVTWSGLGQTGTIPVTLTDSTTITVGELQVITTQ